ncbi:MAG TPA: hypothetical protein VF828_01605 [Patescibacteria group bacterium]
MNRSLLAVNLGDTPFGQASNGHTTTLSMLFPRVSSLINLIIPNAFTLAGVLLLVLLIVGGAQYIINAGGDDPKKMAQAQSIITDAVIGFFIVFLAFVIIQIVQVITGLEILHPSI